MKYSFKNDYADGAHPRILQALLDTYEQQEPGYGLDRFSREASESIRELIKNPHASVYFTSGGTQANLTVISSLLLPFQSVISAENGHIFTNESGAIESTGHKVHGIKDKEGKVTVEAVNELLLQHQNTPHQVEPHLIYLSNSTELGTVYSREELSKLYEFAKEKGLKIFIDGARLAQALTAKDCDYELYEMAQLCDAFYMGGTKNGALLGEAVVFTKKELGENFPFHLKQKGALLAKGRVLGIQFRELLRDNLYFELGAQANEKAQLIAAELKNKGVSFLTSSTTNQIFPLLSNWQLERLEEKFDFYRWKKIQSDLWAARLICSWASSKKSIDAIIEEIRNWP